MLGAVEIDWYTCVKHREEVTRGVLQLLARYPLMSAWEEVMAYALCLPPRRLADESSCSGRLAVSRWIWYQQPGTISEANDAGCTT